MWAKIALSILIVVLGILSQLEVDKDILIIEKAVALPTNRIKTFQFLSKLSNFAQWYPGISAIESAETEPMAIGKHFKMEVRDVPVIGDMSYDNRIIGYESPRFLSFICNNWLEYNVEFSLERSDSKNYPTMLTWRLVSRKRSSLVKYVIAPALRFVLGGNVRQALFNLRHVLTQQ